MRTVFLRRNATAAQARHDAGRVAKLAKLSGNYIPAIAAALSFLSFFLPSHAARAQNNGMQYQIPAAEYSALVDLYNATAGSSWSTYNGWLDPQATSWYGVGVSGVQYDTNGNVAVVGDVTSLSLYSNQLCGSIPDSLGNLSKLQQLGLDDNQLSGSIPDNLTNLAQLGELALADNQLSGSIPDSFTNLVQLYYLDLDSNQLSGSIPAGLGNLSHMAYLNLEYNELTGSIPASLTNLSQVQYLWLGDNQLSGSIPASLGTLSQLYFLDLCDNQLSGSLPASLGNLSQLTELYLDNDRLTGSIPDSFGNLANLEVLVLYGNQLSGSIPASLGNLSQLQTLWLTGNQLSGSIPASLGNLSQLQGLWLDDNQLSGSIPASLGNLSQMSTLDLGSNQLGGEMPDFSNVASAWINVSENCLDISSGSQSLSNIDLMIAAGNAVEYTPQGTNCTNGLQDSVGDGILDAWRAQYFPNQPANNVNGTMTNSQSCAACDADGTGMSNIQKLLAGFNPTNTAAYLHIISVATSSANIIVTYLGASGDTNYVPGVQSRTNVLEFTTGTADGSYSSNSFASAGQTNILSGGTGLGTVTNMTDFGGVTNGPSRYYRVRVVLP